MTFTNDGSILTISFQGVGMLALVALLMLFGFWLKKRINFLRRYCIPTPVASGLLFAFLVLALKMSGVANIQLDTSYQSPFMLCFFATVGLEADLRILRRGGWDLAKYLLLGVVLATWQNIMAVGLAFVTGISPMYGVMMGAATQVGGHGGAAAFGRPAGADGLCRQHGSGHGCGHLRRHCRLPAGRTFGPQAGQTG